MDFGYLDSVRKLGRLTLKMLRPDYHLLVYENIFSMDNNNVSKLGAIRTFKLGNKEYYNPVYFCQGAIQNGAYFLSFEGSKSEHSVFREVALKYLEMLKTGMEVKDDIILFPYSLFF